MMRKKIPLGVTICLMLISAAIAVSASVMLTWKQLNLTVANFNERQAIYNKLGMVDNEVREHFYKDFDEAELLDALSTAYIATLGDRFSAYMNAEEFQKQRLTNDGKSVGIGVSIRQNAEGLIEIIKVEKNGPAEAAQGTDISGVKIEPVGIKTGDVIVSVAGKSVKEQGYDASYQAMLGEEGTSCIFQVKRGDLVINFSVERKEFETVSIEYRMIGTLGYIKIISFRDNTDEQFEKAVKDLQKKGAEGLIFDVRNNGGGTLDSVANMVDLLVPKGDIVSITRKNGKNEVLYKSDKKQVKLPMAVLTNGGTASASELFAAALHDYDKAILVGAKTYGKGVMQTTYELRDGSAVKLTVGLFNPPSGENFNEKGLEPDYHIELTDEQQLKFNEEGLTDETDPQIQEAIIQLLEE